MKKFLSVFIALTLVSCQSYKLAEKQYQVSGSSAELGSIGRKKGSVLKPDFNMVSLPRLENKIRIDVKVLPFNKSLFKIYKKKGRYNQDQASINYIDSIATKPELVTLSVLDVAGFVDEVNSDYNAKVSDYLQHSKKARVVTAITTTLSEDNIKKIKFADSFYLTNSGDAKYIVTLYKQNKKVDAIDLNEGVLLGYELGKCCWSQNKNGKWKLSEITSQSSCESGKSALPKKQDAFPYTKF